MSKTDEKNSVRRAVAVFLLTFAAFDMAVIDMFSPQLCGDEQISFSVFSPLESRGDIQEGLEAKTTDDSESSQDSHSSQIDEDCFCCCSHILPSYATKVMGPLAPLEAIVPVNEALPLAPPQYTYHPPRFA